MKKKIYNEALKKSQINNLRDVLFYDLEALKDTKSKDFQYHWEQLKGNLKTLYTMLDYDFNIIPKIIIDMDKFISWFFENNEESAIDISIRALKTGHKGLKEEIKTKTDYFQNFGYLPLDLIINREEVIENFNPKDEYELNEEDNIPDNIPIIWKR